MSVYQFFTHIIFKCGLKLIFKVYFLRHKNLQREDSRFYLPCLTFKKSFLYNYLVTSLQLLNTDMGLISSNVQRITNSRENSFFTSINYFYEVDVFLLNLSYNFNKTKSNTNFIKREFGEREF